MTEVTVQQMLPELNTPPIRKSVWPWSHGKLCNNDLNRVSQFTWFFDLFRCTCWRCFRFIGDCWKWK